MAPSMACAETRDTTLVGRDLRRAQIQTVARHGNGLDQRRRGHGGEVAVDAINRSDAVLLDDDLL